MASSTRIAVEPANAMVWRTFWAAGNTHDGNAFLGGGEERRDVDAPEHRQYGPGKSRHDDHSLAVYESAGFVGADADRTAATVFTYVLGSGLSESATILLTRRLAREGQDAELALRDAVAEASAIAVRFPRLKARIEQAEGTGYGEAPGNGFDDGLETILDGIERRLSPR